jgi:hypothetical protein
MAEQQTHYEFVTVETKDILADRQQGWESFTKLTTWAIGVIIFLLVAIKVLWG